MKMNLKVLCYVIQVLNSALISQYMTHTQHIHAALIDSLKLLLRGGEGGLLPGDGGRGTRIMVNNNYS